MSEFLLYHISYLGDESQRRRQIEAWESQVGVILALWGDSSREIMGMRLTFFPGRSAVAHAEWGGGERRQAEKDRERRCGYDRTRARSEQPDKTQRETSRRRRTPAPVKVLRCAHANLLADRPQIQGLSAITAVLNLSELSEPSKAEYIFF